MATELYKLLIIEQSGPGFIIEPLSLREYEDITKYLMAGTPLPDNPPPPEPGCPALGSVKVTYSGGVRLRIGGPTGPTVGAVYAGSLLPRVAPVANGFTQVKLFITADPTYTEIDPP